MSLYSVSFGSCHGQTLYFGSELGPRTDYNPTGNFDDDKLSLTLTRDLTFPDTLKVYSVEGDSVEDSLVTSKTSSTSSLLKSVPYYLF